MDYRFFFKKQTPEGLDLKEFLQNEGISVQIFSSRAIWVKRESRWCAKCYKNAFRPSEIIKHAPSRTEAADNLNASDDLEQRKGKNL